MMHDPRILGLGTAAPEFQVSRELGYELAREFSPSLPAEKLRHLYDECGVAFRGSVFDVADMRRFVLEGPDGHGASTDSRLKCFMPNAVELGAHAAAEAFAESGLSSKEVTHLVTVSCTGAQSPGIDHGLIERLGLSPDVSRTHIGFMGCHAGLNGLAVASAFVRADPGAVVMLACVEMCSLHYQIDDPRWDQQVANAIFADGAACALLGSGSEGPGVVGSLSRVFPQSASRMGWEIGQHGFRMTLSPRVPGLIRRHLVSWLDEWLAPRGLAIADIHDWAVHPGGRDILEGVRRGLELEHGRMAEGEKVLQEHGNMSSATILWVLKAHLASNATGPLMALAFGPGLTGEGILITP